VQRFSDDVIDHELTIISFTEQALSSKVAPLDASTCNTSKSARPGKLVSQKRVRPKNDCVQARK
jgi:hypothetical protein